MLRDTKATAYNAADLEWHCFEVGLRFRACKLVLRCDELFGIMAHLSEIAGTALLLALLSATKVVVGEIPRPNTWHIPPDRHYGTQRKFEAMKQCT